MEISKTKYFREGQTIILCYRVHMPEQMNEETRWDARQIDLIGQIQKRIEAYAEYLAGQLKGKYASTNSGGEKWNRYELYVRIESEDIKTPSHQRKGKRAFNQATERVVQTEVRDHALIGARSAGEMADEMARIVGIIERRIRIRTSYGQMGHTPLRTGDCTIVFDPETGKVKQFSPA